MSRRSSTPDPSRAAANAAAGTSAFNQEQIESCITTINGFLQHPRQGYPFPANIHLNASRMVETPRIRVVFDNPAVLVPIGRHFARAGYTVYRTQNYAIEIVIDEAFRRYGH